MLIRRKVIQNPVPTEVENNVTIVRPRRPTGLLVGLGVATLLAVGAVTYLSWYLPNRDIATTTPATVTVDTTDTRPERFDSSSSAPKPSTIIVNPPPVIQTPPVVTTPPAASTPPVIINPPSPPIVVQGSTSDMGTSHRNTNRNRSNGDNGSMSGKSGTNNSDTNDDNDNGSNGNDNDVDGRLQGTTGD